MILEITMECDFIFTKANTFIKTNNNRTTASINSAVMYGLLNIFFIILEYCIGKLVKTIGKNVANKSIHPA